MDHADDRCPRPEKTITLFALVGPITMIPVFLAAAEGLDPPGKFRFARTIGISVTIALLAAAFHAACHAQKQIRQSTLDIVERVSGFILAAMAVEMIATGLRGLFPALAPG